MKKRRALRLILLVLLLVGIPTVLTLRAVHHEQLNRALIDAIMRENTPVALAILHAGADPNTRDHSYDKPLNLSERFKRILDTFQHPNHAPDEHSTPITLLFSGKMKDNPTLIKALLDAGGDPNVTDWTGMTPLMMAADYDHHESLRLLISRGANPNTKGAFGLTPLHYAAMFGEKQTVQILIRAGANINANSDDRTTPLHTACHYDNYATVETLLDHQARVNMRDSVGKTPLDMTTDIQITDILRKAGAKTGKELSSASSTSPPKR